MTIIPAILVFLDISTCLLTAAMASRMKRAVHIVDWIKEIITYVRGRNLRCAKRTTDTIVSMRHIIDSASHIYV